MIEYNGAITLNDAMNMPFDELFFRRKVIEENSPKEE